MKTNKMREIEKRTGQPIKKAIKEQYHAQYKSMAETAKTLGVSRSRIAAWFKELKIPTRTLSEAQALIQSKQQKYSVSEIKKMYLKKGLSQQKIADRLELNQATISKILTREGIRSGMPGRLGHVPLHKKDIGEKRLKELYIKKGLSTHKIAKSTGVKQITVFRWLKKYGIKRRDLSQAQFTFRGKKVKKPSKNELYTWYITTKKSEPQIARMLGTDVTTISNWLKEYGIERRGLMEARFVSLGKDVKKPSKQQLYKWYVKDRLSTVDIAKKLGVSTTPIVSWLKDYNIKVRSGSEALFNVYGKEVKKPTRTQLLNWYVIKKMSSTEIANITGAAKTTVLGWLKEKGITRRKTREATLAIYKRRPEIIKAIRKKRLEQVFPVRDTKIEQKMQSELKKRGIRFRTHLPVENICQPDIIIPEHKIIVQCDGDYWHANPKGRKLTKQQKATTKRDREQDIILKERGWRVLRFWESDINKDISACIDLIEAELRR